jgi:O-antigen/teichoic acid export membrane protein
MTPAASLWTRLGRRDWRLEGWLGHASLILLSQVLAAGLGVIYWIVAARFFPASEVGQASAELSFVFLLSTVAELGLRSALVRYLPQQPGNGRRIVLQFAALNSLAAVVLAAAAVLSPWRWVAESWVNTIWLVPAVLGWTLYFVQSGALIGLRLTNQFLLQSVLFNAGKLVLLVGAASLAVPYAVVASWFLAAPVMAIGFWALTLHRADSGRRQGSPAIPLRQMLSLVSLDYAGSLLAEASLRLLPLAILRLIGAAEAAYFYQAFLVSSMIRLVTSSLVASYTVEAARNPSMLRSHSRRMILIALVLSAGGGVFLAIFAGWVLLVFGEEYARNGATALRLLGASATPYVINAWFIAYARLKGRGGLILINEAAQFVCTFVPLLILVPDMGLTGVALACLIGQIGPLVFTVGALRQVFGKDDVSIAITSSPQ